MKESIRAAREEVALKRQVEAVKSLAGAEQAKALEALSGPARYPDYNRLMQQELIAEILEETNQAEETRRKIAEAAVDLFDNRLGWSEGRQPYAPRDIWADLGAAIYGEDDPSVEELRSSDGPPNPYDDAASPDLSFLSEEQAEALHDAGYTKPEEMQEASDEELEAVAHVGKATVKKIREALKG